MANNYFFYPDGSHEVYGPMDIAPPVESLPLHTYARSYRGDWYVRLGAGFTPINLSDIPKEIKMTCLVLGVSCG